MKHLLISGALLYLAALQCSFAITSFAPQVLPTDNEVPTPRQDEVIQGFAAEDLKQFTESDPKPSINDNFNEVINGETHFIHQSSDNAVDSNTESEPKVNEYFGSTPSSYLPTPEPNNDIPSTQDDNVYNDNKINDEGRIPYERNDGVFRPIDDQIRFNRPVYERRNDFPSDQFRGTDNPVGTGCGVGGNFDGSPNPRPFYPPASSNPYHYHPERSRRMDYMNPEMSYMPGRFFGPHLPYYRYHYMMNRMYPMNPMSPVNPMNPMMSRMMYPINPMMNRFMYPMSPILNRFMYLMPPMSPMMSPVYPMSPMMYPMGPMMRRFPPYPIIIYKLLQPIIIKPEKSSSENDVNSYRPEKYFNNFNEPRFNRLNNFQTQNSPRLIGRNMNSDEDNTIHIRFIYKE